MTDKEILQKAIKKVEKNDYLVLFSLREALDVYLSCNKYYSIIFSHDFAKAFWGYEKIVLQFRSNWTIENDLEDIDSIFAWRYHLQKIVLEKEPLKYLEKFLDE